MSKKDYVKIAAVFAAVPHETMVDGAEGEEPNDSWHNLREKIADMLHYDNPNFDREKFYRACGE